MDWSQESASRDREIVHRLSGDSESELESDDKSVQFHATHLDDPPDDASAPTDLDDTDDYNLEAR